MTGYPKKFESNNKRAKAIHELLIFISIIIMSLMILGSDTLAIKGCSIPRRRTSTSEQTTQPSQMKTEQEITQEVQQPIKDNTNLERKITRIEKFSYINFLILGTLLVFALVDFTWRMKTAKAILNLDREVSKIMSNLNKLLERIIELESQIGKQNVLSSQEMSHETLQETPIEEELKQFSRNHIEMSRRIQEIKKEKSPLEQFIDLYNEAVKDPSIRNEFNSKYNPIRMGVKNFQDRRVNPKIAAQFENWDSGDYIIVKVNLDEGTRYVSVPRFDLPIQDANYGPGAIGQVFNCPGYKPQFQYLDSMVVRPAFFEQGDNRNQWILKEQGELKLGQNKEK